MKSKSKKIIASCLVLVFVISLCGTVLAVPPPRHFKSKKVKSSGGYIYYSRKYGPKKIEGASYGIKKIPTKLKGKKVTSIYQLAFSRSTKVKTFVIPKYVKSIGNAAFYASSNKAFKVARGNKYFKTSNGILYNKKKTSLIAYPYKKTSKSYTMPSSVINANKGASLGGKYLTSVTLGRNLKYVNNLSFKGASSLKTINISSSNKYYKIVNGLLLTKSGKTLVYAPPKIGLVNVPYGVTRINSIKVPSTSVVTIPSTVGNSYFFEDIDIPFTLLQGDKAFKNLLHIFINESQSYATLTGGTISSCKAITEDNTVKLNIKSLYYDTSSYNDPTWGSIKKSTKDPWFMDKQFDVYRNNTKIATIDYNYSQDSVDYIDKNQSNGTNSYYVVPKFKMYDKNKRTISVTWYKSPVVSITR